jgi:catechol 2,3-dioxygenase-like lactoylglutathione lyase family enzyme
MADFPPVVHVAVTVRDLSVSVPWYEALFGAKPVLDEDTDPDFHHTVYMNGNGTPSVCTSMGRRRRARSSASSGPASTTSASVAPTEPNSRSGHADSTSSASSTVASRMRRTARA